MRFQDLLRRDGDTSAALAAAIARAEAAGLDAATKLEGLDRVRAEALIGDDERALDRIEEKIRLTQRDADRSRLAVQELRHRLAVAQQAEHQARLDTIHSRGTAAQEKAAKLITTRYRKLATEMAALVAELAALEAEVADVNLQLAQEGDRRIITPGDELARPHRGPGPPLLPVAIHHGLRLPAPEDGTRFSWPENADIFNVDRPAAPVIQIGRGDAA